MGSYYADIDVQCWPRSSTTWTLIGVAIVLGIGIMISVSNSGSKENIEIDRK